MTYLHELIKQRSEAPFLKGWFNVGVRCIGTKEQHLQVSGALLLVKLIGSLKNFIKMMCMYKITVYCEMSALHLMITHCLLLKCAMGFVHRRKLVSS